MHFEETKFDNQVKITDPSIMKPEVPPSSFATITQYQKGFHLQLLDIFESILYVRKRTTIIRFLKQIISHVSLFILLCYLVSIVLIVNELNLISKFYRNCILSRITYCLYEIEPWGFYQWERIYSKKKWFLPVFSLCFLWHQ